MSNIIEKLGITKGPWEYVIDEEGINAPDEIIEITYDDYACAWPVIKKEPDAKLIACSPEMLEALIDFVFDCEIAYDGMETEFLKATIEVRALIEKATNKTWEEIKELLI